MTPNIYKQQTQFNVNKSKFLQFNFQKYQSYNIISNIKVQVCGRMINTCRKMTLYLFFICLKIKNSYLRINIIMSGGFTGGGFVGGGFEYNLTTESEFEEMKQRNAMLLHQNQSLKQSLEELIRVNNELTDSMEEFNNSASRNRYKDNNFQSKIEELNAQIQHYKGLALTQQDRAEIVNALQGLIESFKQTQKYYQEEINNLCTEIEHYKNQWEEKIGQLEDMYMKKMKNVEMMATEIRKKEEIVNIIERKMMDQKLPEKKKLIKRYSTDLDTISEKLQNKSNNNTNPQQFNILQKEIEDLKAKQDQLNKDLHQKDRTISVYSELLANMRKKLMEKY